MEKESTKADVILGVDVSVLAHATEDEERVERAVMNVIPEMAGGFRRKTQRLRGHHNSPIIHMALWITVRRSALETLRFVLRSLSTLDLQRLLDEAEERIDETGNLYVRLDKQKAYKGMVVLNETDPIRMKFRFRIPHRASSINFVRECLAELIEEVEPR